jgi:hypothetical protein
MNPDALVANALCWFCRDAAHILDIICMVVVVVVIDVVALVLMHFQFAYFNCHIFFYPNIFVPEIAEDFKSYRNRFSTPNTPWPIPLDKMWYSFDVGLVHFIR